MVYHNFWLPVLAFNFPQLTKSEALLSIARYTTSGKNILKDQGLNPIKPIIEGEIAKVPSSLSIVWEETSTTSLSQGSKINLTG